LTFDLWVAKQELIVFLRNQDVLSTTVRDVTTTTQRATPAPGYSTVTISRVNVRNVRSITVATISKSFGYDYTVEYTHNAGATQDCLITFNANQTGEYIITYDYGTDRIFPDYPRPDRTLASYPVVAVETISSSTKEISLGATNGLTEVIYTAAAYAASERTVEGIIKLIKEAVMAHKKDLYYLRFITVAGTGPLLKTPMMNDKIVQRNIDLRSPFNLE
jgi:hypothetical protein